jgi:hypothetical protein
MEHVRSRRCVPILSAVSSAPSGAGRRSDEWTRRPAKGDRRTGHYTEGLPPPSPRLRFARMEAATKAASPGARFS